MEPVRIVVRFHPGATSEYSRVADANGGLGTLFPIMWRQVQRCSSAFGSALLNEEFAPALGADSSVHQGARCRRHEMPATTATLSVVRVVLIARGRLWNLRCLALCADRQQPGSYTSTAYDDTAPGKHRRAWIGICGVGHFITQAASFL